MLETIEHETRPDPEWAVIWLHGLGADGRDFEPLVPELVARAWPAIRFVFPHAPVRAVTINRGMRMRAWYDILGTEIAARQDEAGVRESVLEIEALIEREVQRGIASERVILAGFSQGGAIVLACGVRHPRRLGGIVALSTYLPLAERGDAEFSAANRGLPIFMGHGSADPVVPEALGVMSRDFLVARGYAVEWHSYRMPHSVCADEIVDLARWLTQRFDARDA
ncbi:MAG TPA: carboxylesterase [Candidatus Saccharimonadia bacterium]|nr:carboxylesterase [Candidatus Saccharimonadia bacterium]